MRFPSNSRKGPTMLRRLFLVNMVAGVVVLGGCVGYRLGNMLPPDIRSVHVPTFVNKSGEPQIEIEATRATIRELQKDGSLEISSRSQANSVLEVTMTEYKLIPISFDRDSRRSPNEYRATITAEIVFRRRGETSALIKRELQGENDFTLVGDMATAKRTALPKAAKDLAHDIVESITDFWMTEAPTPDTL